MNEEENRSGLKKQIIKWGIGIILPVLIISGLYGFQSFLKYYPDLAEAYSRTLFRWLTYVPMKLTSLIPISLTEVFVVTGVLSSPLLLAWFIIRMVRALKKKEGRKFFFTKGRILAWGLCIVYFIFMLFHGINYMRKPLDQTLFFGQENYSVEELGEVYIWVLYQINETREVCCEDENGVLAYPGGLRAFWNDAQKYYKESAVLFPTLQGNIGRPKPVALSHYWSYTDIVGIYDPLLAECNINKDTPFTETCSSAFHEMTHLNGYAVENNANLASLLLRMQSSCPEIRYTGFYDALPLIEDDLYKALGGDVGVIRQILAQIPLCDGLFRDVQAYDDYWKSINPPPIVKEVSNNVNDSFLKANQQEEGVKSYHMMPSVVADYYFKYVKE